MAITDVTGKIIWRLQDVHEQTIQLPVEKVASGTYMVRVGSGSSFKIIKFIKK